MISSKQYGQYLEPITRRELEDIVFRSRLLRCFNTQGLDIIDAVMNLVHSKKAHAVNEYKLLYGIRDEDT